MIGLWLALLLAPVQDRVVETVVPGAADAVDCTSTVEIANGGSRTAEVQVEAHRESGGLIALRESSKELAPGERRSYRLEPGAWTRVRERIRGPDEAPVVAARGVTECIEADRLLSAARDPVFPLRNPWYEGDGTSPGAVILLINAGETPARASGCYSTGNLYSLPDPHGRPSAFLPVCSETFDVQVPPFAALRFPTDRNGARWFGLRTRGPSIVLQMLRPSGERRRAFVVDSTIRFGEEVTSR